MILNSHSLGTHHRITEDDPVHSWVIGAGGLLGSALCRQMVNPFVGQSVPWVNPEAASHALSESLEDFAALADGEPWRIIWAAGRATTSATPEEAAQELATFERFIDALIHRSLRAPGSFTLVSSAGSLYAGNRHPPFNSASEPRPIGTYGNLKLAQERATSRLPKQGTSTTIARVSNLYGPGQDLRKLQGVVSRLCWAGISKEEVNIFVPLDTLRDYIYVDDAAARILHWSTSELSHPSTEPSVRVVASGQSMGIGCVINTVEDVLHIRIPVSFGTHPTAAEQAPDIRLTPDTDASLARLPTTPFPSGVRRVFEDLLRRHQSASHSSNCVG